MHSTADESEEAGAGLAQSGAGSPDRHPLSLWIDRQRAAWFKRWKWVFLALLIIQWLSVGLAAYYAWTSHRAMITHVSPWWANLSPPILMVYTAVYWLSFGLIFIVVNLSVAQFGASVASIPDDLEIALPVGESTRFLQSAFHRLAIQTIFCIQVIPFLGLTCVRIVESIYSSFHTYYTSSVVVTPPDDLGYVWSAALKLLSGVACVLTYLAIAEIHAFLNLRLWKQVSWERVLVPVAPYAIYYVAVLVYYYTYRFFDTLETWRYYWELFVLVQSGVAFAMYLGLRRMAAAELPRAIARRG